MIIYRFNNYNNTFHFFRKDGGITNVKYNE